MKSAQRKPRLMTPVRKKLEFGAKEFVLADFGKTLFPLTTNKILVEYGYDSILAHIKKVAYTDQEHQKKADALAEEGVGGAFLPQKRVFAMKQEWHTRRTVKLDVIAETFIYDIVYRNRRLFRNSFDRNRRCFGYRFHEGTPIEGTLSYRNFKGAKSEYRQKYRHSTSFDIATYFNNVYHHDLVQWFDERGAAEADVVAFGAFLRETNSGRSVDCLPQGLYPCKMIGNDFLKYVDNSNRLKSSVLIRFMDDFILFDDDPNVLMHDFVFIQELLGHKGLSVNPSKTTLGADDSPAIDVKINSIKRRLLRRRREIVATGYDGDEEEIELPKLSRGQASYLKDLLSQRFIEEDDAELILSVMGRVFIRRASAAGRSGERASPSRKECPFV